MYSRVYTYIKTYKIIIGFVRLCVNRRKTIYTRTRNSFGAAIERNVYFCDRGASKDYYNFGVFQSVPAQAWFAKNRFMILTITWD
jgi:hypothetical protein